jgi:acetyltransferase-like isoleucine patch superfamily enzyme
VSPLADVLSSFRQRALDRLRGEPNIERMVAEGLVLGEGTHIARPLYLDRSRPWLITIGDYANLAPYVMVITHDASLHNYTGLTRIARVVVGNRVMVGAGAILLPGTDIGDDSVVAAGAVVRGEIPPGSLVTGDPAKVSKIGVVAAWQRASAAGAPSWPLEGWSTSGGITEARKRQQREALAGGASGYVPARAAPGSRYALKALEGQSRA